VNPDTTRRRFALFSQDADCSKYFLSITEPNEVTESTGFVNSVGGWWFGHGGWIPDLGLCGATLQKEAAPQRESG